MEKSHNSATLCLACRGWVTQPLLEGTGSCKGVGIPSWCQEALFGKEREKIAAG